MRAVWAGLAGLAALAAPLPALAHPHIFIDAALEVVFSADGRAEGVRVRWSYDEFFSLTLVAERGLDPDFDGMLTPEELVQMNGFDMGWQPEFQGDTYALLDTAPLALSRPMDWTVAYEGGKLISTHYRRFDTPVDLGAGPLLVQSYDPGYYTAYAVVDATVTGRDDCTVDIYEPDREAADQILQEALAEFAGDEAAEADFPAVGAAYAEEARVSCGG
jgi:polyphosphate kinase